MRKLKFRVWDSINKRFNEAIDYYTFDIKITPESIEDGLVSQYTGLTDRNGTEIYEGDIVKLSNEQVGEVIYDEISNAAYCVHFTLDQGKELVLIDLGKAKHAFKCVVIGNIFGEKNGS